MGNLFKDTAIAPISLLDINHYNLPLVGKLDIEFQFDPLTNAGYRLYYRVDETAAAPSAALGTFLPEGYLTAGGAVEIHIDPKLSETPYLHVLLTDEDGAAASGGANDRVLLTAYRANPD